MNIKLLLLVVLVALLAGCTGYSKLLIEDALKEGKPNLLYNGDFEIYQEEINDILPGWTLDKSDEDIVSIDTTRSFSGDMSLKIDQPSGEIQLISGSFPVYHRNIYGIRFSAKSSLKRVPVQVNLLTFKSNGKIKNRFKNTVIIEKQWGTYYLRGDFLNSASEFGRIFFTIPANESDILIDDISCTNVLQYSKK